jgi:hypothetical protein
MKTRADMDNMNIRIRALFSPKIAERLISKIANKDINYWDSLIFEEFEIECPDWISNLSYDKYREGADESFYSLVWEEAAKLNTEIQPLGQYIKSTYTPDQINKLIEIIRPGR